MALAPEQVGSGSVGTSRTRRSPYDILEWERP